MSPTNHRSQRSSPVFRCLGLIAVLVLVWCSGAVRLPTRPGLSALPI